MEFRYEHDPYIRVEDKMWIGKLHKIFKEEFPIWENTEKGEKTSKVVSQLLAIPPHSETRAAFVNLPKENVYELHWSYMNKQGNIIREVDTKNENKDKS